MSRNTDIVVTGVGAGALTTILVWIVDAGFKFKIPAEVAAAVTTLMIIVAGWFVPAAKPQEKEEE